MSSSIPDTKISDTLATIAHLAPTIGAEYDAQTNAIQAERQAEADLLARAIDLARPGLRACLTRRRIHESTRDTATDHERTTYRSGPPALLLAGYAGPREDAPRDSLGTYADDPSLWLLADGSLVSVEYAGSWSRWKGSGQEWTATLMPITIAVAVREWRLADILATIADALQRQAGKRDAAGPRDRAARLAAIATLAPRR